MSAVRRRSAGALRRAPSCGSAAPSPPAASRRGGCSPGRSPATSLDELGDGKPGSANVGRSVGWGAGAAVLALDAGQGLRCRPRRRVWPAPASGTVAAMGITHACSATSSWCAAAAPPAPSAPSTPWTRAMMTIGPRAARRRHAAAPSSAGRRRDRGLPAAAPGWRPAPSPARRAVGRCCSSACCSAARLRGTPGAPPPTTRRGLVAAILAGQGRLTAGGACASDS